MRASSLRAGALDEAAGAQEAVAQEASAPSHWQAEAVGSVRAHAVRMTVTVTAKAEKQAPVWTGH
jgi:hypothetical protein